jgi:hypothetical protein
LDAKTAARQSARAINRIGQQRFRTDAPELATLHERHRAFTYFVGRPSPLGGSWRVAHAVTGVFPPGLMEKGFVRVGQAQPLEEFRAEYSHACDAIGQRMFAPLPHAAELAGLLQQLVDAIDFAGRPLAAAWMEAPRGAGIGTAVERLVTVLREYRGDGHQSALAAAGMLGCESLIVASLWRGGDGEGIARFFGWRDDDLAAARERLVAAGRLDGAGELTAAGREERETIEEVTDALATPPWHALGEHERERLVSLLVATAEGLPSPI